MSVLIKQIVNVGPEGITFTLTGKASMDRAGLSTDQWYVSWDKIGTALFGDQYSGETVVRQLRIDRGKPQTRRERQNGGLQVAEGDF